MKSIYIINSNKKELLKELRCNNPFNNIKIYTLKELETIYPYKYNSYTLDYIMNKYNVILDIASTYLYQITHYNIDLLDTPKAIFLKELKGELIDNNLLVLNNPLINYFNNNKVYTYLPNTKEVNSYLRYINNIEFIDNTNPIYIPNIYKCNTKEEEYLFIGEQIAHLIKNNISPESIYISNLEANDYTPISFIFDTLNISLSTQNSTLLSDTSIGKDFINLINNNSIKDSIEILKNNYKEPKEQEIINNIINICNKYNKEINIKEFIINDLKAIKTKTNTIKNAITEMDYKNTFIKDNEYLFILNGNESILNKNYKDEDYLSDKEKEIINIETSSEKTLLNNKILLNKIKSIKNLTITYLDKKPISNILEEFTPKEITLNYDISNTYNIIKFGTLLDDLRKYNTESDLLHRLDNNYDIDYQTYNNKYTKIDHELFSKYLNNKLNLSYTKIDLYNKCPFSFYLKYILKVDTKEDSFNLYMGSLIHKILELDITDNNDIDNMFNDILKEKEWSYKEIFFINKLKEETKYITKELQIQKDYTNLNNVTRERQYNVILDDKTSFTGIIDKILYKDNIVSIIDYKTGSTTIKKEYMPLGYSLQLPIYLYLIKKNTSNTIGGIYLQNIIPGRINDNGADSFESQKKKALKLTGYSNKDFNILKEVDNTYQNSKLINSLKVTTKGDFYSYSKVLDNDDMNTIYNLVDKIINNVKDSIWQEDFPIKDIIIDNKDNISCKYCNYKSICHKTNKDTIYLKSDHFFLSKEDKNGLD